MTANDWRPTTELLDDLLEGFQVIDRQWRYQYMNPAAARHGRTTPQAMIGRTMMECYPGIEQTHIYLELARCMRTNEPILVETEFQFEDGTSGFFEVRAEPAADAICILSLDVTERRRAQTRAQESEDRRHHGERLESIGLLSAGIAHDFNNLLCVMLGQGELALARASGPKLADVEMMVDAARRSAMLTRELLAFGRRQVMTPQIIDPREVISGLTTLLRRSIGSDIDLVFDTSRGVGAIEIDPSKLEQVLVNLVINARDAMPRGGRITIALSELRAARPDASASVGAVLTPKVVLCVTDDGAGMDEATRARIFEPFFTTKERGMGTGLGLASVHGIVLQSGGTIRVESELGKGTTFVLTFPRHDDVADESRDGSSARARVPRVADAARDGESVLVAEDHPQVCKLAETVLLSAGYRVFIAGTGPEALDRIRDEPSIALVLADMVLPGMRGPELIERAREVRPQLRFVCTSGYALEGDEDRHGLPEEVVYLEKPYLPSVLLRLTREVLDEGHAVRA